MFSGIIQAVGKVTSILTSREGGIVLKIQTPKLTKSLRTGDSIALDGVCLTVTKKDRRTHSNGHFGGNVQLNQHFKL